MGRIGFMKSPTSIDFKGWLVSLPGLEPGAAA